MSADNGIYIGRFLKSHSSKLVSKSSYEYRVVHGNAFENCDYDEQFPKELTQANRVLYYGESEVYNENEAWNKARALYQDILDSDCPICEYGIQQINYDEWFPVMTKEEANQYMKKYWDNVGSNRK